jgi:hypothetical protein
MLVLVAVLGFAVCVIGALALGILRIRVEARVNCSICGREIPWDRYQRTVLWQQFRRGPAHLDWTTPCEDCAAGYPVLDRPSPPSA